MKLLLYSAISIMGILPVLKIMIIAACMWLMVSKRFKIDSFVVDTFRLKLLQMQFLALLLY